MIFLQADERRGTARLFLILLWGMHSGCRLTRTGLSGVRAAPVNPPQDCWGSLPPGPSL